METLIHLEAKEMIVRIIAHQGEPGPNPTKMSEVLRPLGGRGIATNKAGHSPSSTFLLTKRK